MQIGIERTPIIFIPDMLIVFGVVKFSTCFSLGDEFWRCFLRR